MSLYLLIIFLISNLNFSLLSLFLFKPKIKWSPDIKSFVAANIASVYSINMAVFKENMYELPAK